MPCSRLGVIELVGYREWTETLGHDREWRIQETQARLYAVLQDTAKDIEAHVIPLRMDYMLVLAENVGDLTGLVKVLEEEAPVPHRIAVAKAPTPSDAEAAATRVLGSLGPRGLGFREICMGEELSTIAHIDINDITTSLRRDGTTVYTSYMRVIQLYGRLQALMAERGAIVSYLGGDNILAVLPPGGEGLVRSVMSSELKAGVGTAPTPRRALGLATLALDTIRREGRKQGRVLVLGDGGPGGGTLVEKVGEA